MKADKAERSLRRRIMFAGKSRIFFDTLAGKTLTAPLPLDPTYWRVPDKLANIAFDLVECLRTTGRVPNFGDARQAAALSPGRTAQYPRQLSYWYDSSKHVLVGMQLGVDVIKRANKFYIIENNLGAAIRPERRQLYDTPFDPIVTGLVIAARDAGFRRLVPNAPRWSEAYMEEFERAGEEFGVDVRPASSPCHQPNGKHPMVGLPEPLPESTMYVFFSGQDSPVDHFVHNKTISAAWLSEGISERTDPEGPLDLIRTENRLFEPPPGEDERWPNMAIKLDGWDQGQFVAVGRFDSKAQAREALKLRHDADRPGIFDLNVGQRLSTLLFDKGTPVYQEFIPPECDSNGNPTKIRLHTFVSPLINRYLSAHAMVAPGAPSEKLEAGQVRKDGTFVLSFRKGARYTALTPDAEDDLKAVSDAFGRILNVAIAEKFEIGPGHGGTA